MVEKRQPFLTQETPVNDSSLNILAHLPTKSLPLLTTPAFLEKLTDRDFMRIAVLLAEKSYIEGGCPIGAVVVDQKTSEILGKGHNTLVQENHPYNHGETSAIRDAGRIDFSTSSLYTSLSPCDVCTALILSRGFQRVIVGDVTNASGNEKTLKDNGLDVDILEDPEGIALYSQYRSEFPEKDLEDWGGMAAINKTSEQ